MIDAIIRWSLNNRALVLLGSVLAALLGVWSLRETPVDALPDLSDVQVIIKTSWPGQTPQVVEDQVTYPLTTAMLAVPQAVAVRGYSYFGDSFVYVIFEDGVDLYWARSRVLEYLSQVSAALPEGAEPALGPDATGVGWVFQYALVDRTGQHDLAQLRSLQDWFLKYELQTVPGVAEVATVGGMVRQYQVVVDPDKLRAFGIDLARVQAAIRGGNQEAGGAVIEMAEAEYVVRVSGNLGGLADLRRVPVSVGDSGAPILLSDLADIRVGPQMRRGLAELNGEGEVVGGIVVMRAGGNAATTISAVRARLAELVESLPEGVEVVTTYDRSSLIQRAVDTLQRTLLEEFLVVALVCALFLAHLRSAAVVVLALPVGVLTAFTIMRLQGINANIMSLGGIAIAIGAMVDGAIVLVENVHRKLEERQDSPTPTGRHEGHWQAVTEAALEVGRPLFMSLLIVTLSFLPVFALQAQEGRLFSPLAFTKTYAMAAAAGLSITLAPVLAGYCIRGRLRPAARNPLGRLLGFLYAPVIRGVLRFPKWTLAAALAVLLVGLWPLTRLGSEFMPPLDEGDLMYMPSTYPGISIDKARELLQQTDRLIHTLPEVKTVFGKIGRAETATDPAPLTMIETVIQFKARSQWRPGMTPAGLRAELDRIVQLPGLNNAWVMPIKTRIDMLATGIKTPVGVKVAGPDLKVIEDIGRLLESTLRQVPGTASVYSERVAGGRYLHVDIDRQRAARYGLNISHVQDIVRTAVGGMDLTRTVEGLERYPVQLRYPQRVRNSVERLRALPIITPEGAHIPLMEVADVRVEEGPPVIKSENARPNGWTYVDIEDRALGAYVAEAQQAVAEAVTLPPGYSLRWSGQYEYLARAWQRLSLIGPLTLGLIIVLLTIALRRAADVAIVLGALPLGLIGGLWMVHVLDYQLSVAVGVGFIALAGVAVELGVVMLTYLNLALTRRVQVARAAGRSPGRRDVREAVLEGVSQRLRPIAMTVATVVAGLAPVMLSSGAGAEVMHRIAAPMFGGMISATALTLVVIPALFYLSRRRRLGSAGTGVTEARSGGGP